MGRSMSAVLWLGLCALFLSSPCGPYGVSSAEDKKAASPDNGTERWPRTLLSTESYHLHPYDSGCLLLPWSAIFTILVRMLTNNPQDHQFLKDMSVAPERMPTYLAEYQPSTKYILLFSRFAWVLVAFVGLAVVGARFAKQCGGERRQEVDGAYMFYYSKLLTVTQGVVILAACAFIILFLSHNGIGSSIEKAPDYFTNALHDLRVYTNLTSLELGTLANRAVNIVSLKGFITYANRSKMNWTEGELRQAWEATESERKRADKLLADIPTYNADAGNAAKKPKGTFTEQGIAKIEERFRWFDEMTGVWGYYAHPILRPAAVFLFLISAVVAGVGTVIGHKNHSELEDPIKRKQISNIAGHMLLTATFLMFLFCVAALLVIKRSTPHAIAGQCYVCDQYRRKDYEQLQHAQDIVWPAAERADIYKNMYVGDVLQYCSGEGVSIDFFIKRNKAASNNKTKKPEEAKHGLGRLLFTRFRCEPVAAVRLQNGAKLLLWVQYAERLYNRRLTKPTPEEPTSELRIDELVTMARRYYFCSILEHRASFSAQQEAVREASTDSFGPGMCSPVFGIAKTGLSLFCDAFLEYLKSTVLTLFLAVLLFFVGMPTLLMLSKYYLIMHPPPPEPVKASPSPAQKRQNIKESSGSAVNPSGDAGGSIEGSLSNSAYGAAGGVLPRGGPNGTAAWSAAGSTAWGEAGRTARSGAQSDSGSSKDTYPSYEKRLPKRQPSKTDLTEALRQPGIPMLLKSPDALFSAGQFDIFPSDSGNLSDIDVLRTAPAISIKNVKTKSKSEWCVVDTSEMWIPMSQLERAQEWLTSSSAASLARKKCSVEILRLPPSSDCWADGPTTGQLALSTLGTPTSRLGTPSTKASTEPHLRAPPRSSTEKKPQSAQK